MNISQHFGLVCLKLLTQNNSGIFTDKCINGEINTKNDLMKMFCGHKKRVSIFWLEENQTRAVPIHPLRKSNFLSFKSGPAGATERPPGINAVDSRRFHSVIARVPGYNPVSEHSRRLKPVPVKSSGPLTSCLYFTSTSSQTVGVVSRFPPQ